MAYLIQIAFNFQNNNLQDKKEKKKKIFKNLFFPLRQNYLRKSNKLKNK